MLRFPILVSLLAFSGLTIATGTNGTACDGPRTDGTYGLPDDNAASGTSRVRLEYVSDAYDSVVDGSYHGSTGTPTAGTTGLIGAKGCPTQTSGSWDCAYDSAESTVTITFTGGYTAANDGEFLALEGPGILTLAFMDIDAGDKLDVNTPGGVESDVAFTEYFHDCETRDVTFNNQNDWCHNILTEKVLSPEPVVLADGPTVITLTVAVGSPGKDGFTLKYKYDDVYWVDRTGTDTVTMDDGTTTCDVSDMDTLTTGSSAPTTQPTAWFVDTDVSRMKIQGNLYASDATADGFKVTLQYLTREGADALADGTEVSLHYITREGTESGVVVEDIESYPIATSPISIGSKALRRSLNSPSLPRYQFKVQSCTGDNCNLREPTMIRVVDIGEYRPRAKFYNDFDPLARQIMGEITIQAHHHAMGLQGYRLCPTGDGTTCLGADSDKFELDEPKSCPPDENNDDYVEHVLGGTTWKELAEAQCGNSSPYSPKCVGKSCHRISIRAAESDDGEFYITRFDTISDADTTQAVVVGFDAGVSEITATGALDNRLYGDNEYARIYLPRRGWLQPVLLAGIDASDSLTLQKAPGQGHDTHPDLAAVPLQNYIDLDSRESVITWSTDEKGTGNGWTLVYKPDYPEVSLPQDTELYPGAQGFKVVPVFGSKGAGIVTTDTTGDDVFTSSDYLTEAGSNTQFVETYDWIVPNVTCTPTTMHCPIPYTWAHLNYETPKLLPWPDEGSCEQYFPNKATASFELDECGDAYRGHRWAGNCGTAESHFFFQKMSCGSTRGFFPERSVIQDHIQLTPSQSSIAAILEQYYTTKVPAGSVSGTSLETFTFITNDYHVPPILPPRINCTCEAGMDAYTSLLTLNLPPASQINSEMVFPVNATWAILNQAVLEAGLVTQLNLTEGETLAITNIYEEEVRRLTEIGDVENTESTEEDLRELSATTTKTRILYTIGVHSSERASNLVEEVKEMKEDPAPFVAVLEEEFQERGLPVIEIDIAEIVFEEPTIETFTGFVQGSPVTLSPELLNTGVSKMIATIRVYQDPTYAIPATAEVSLPTVVQRFYVEVSTKFTRNRITISDCFVADIAENLNATGAPKPRDAFCDTPAFETESEGAPAGITHIDRVSFRKFRFATTDDVFVQCKIRACQQQPCGECDSRRALQEYDDEPAEGDIFTPTVAVRVSRHDNSALVLPSVEADPDQGADDGAVDSSARGPENPKKKVVAETKDLAALVQAPIQIESEMELPFSPAWASTNRASLVGSLRASLGLREEENLIITQIKAARRGLSGVTVAHSGKRGLQAGGGVKIEFLIGVHERYRASSASAALTSLASGTGFIVQQFVASLDQSLQSRGQPPVRLSPSAVRCAKPTIHQTSDLPQTLIQPALPLIQPTLPPQSQVAAPVQQGPAFVQRAPVNTPERVQAKEKTDPWVSGIVVKLIWCAVALLFVGEFAFPTAIGRSRLVSRGALREEKA